VANAYLPSQKKKDLAVVIRYRRTSSQQCIQTYSKASRIFASLL